MYNNAGHGERRADEPTAVPRLPRGPHAARQAHHSHRNHAHTKRYVARHVTFVPQALAQRAIATNER